MKALKKSAAARAVSALAAAVMTTLMVASQMGLARHYTDQPDGQTAKSQKTRAMAAADPERSPVWSANLASEPLVFDFQHNTQSGKSRLRDTFTGAVKPL